MFFPEGTVRVQVYGKPVDTCCSFDGLYVFINRRGTQMKVLYWDRSDFCVWAKRLEQGRLVSDGSKVTTRTIDWTGLKLLLEGIEPERVKRRFRFPERARQASWILGFSVKWRA